MAFEESVGDILDLREGRSHQHAGPLALAAAVDRGLPVRSLDSVVNTLAPGDQTFAYRIVPKATLARRRNGGGNGQRASKLTGDESARVMRLAKIWTMARAVWHEDDAARAFLFRPHPLLDQRTPIDVVLSNEFGLPIVEGILGRLRYGAAA